MYWYTLFIKTRREYAVEKLLSKQSEDMFIPFIPEKEFFFRKAGRVKKNKNLYFLDTYLLNPPAMCMSS